LTLQGWQLRLTNEVGALAPVAAQLTQKNHMQLENAVTCCLHFFSL
jgi:hypothetical protein